MIKRVRNLEERGLVKVRRSINQIQAGDLILLKYSESNQHAGIVMDTPNGYVRYVSVNVQTMGEGDTLIRFEDGAIVYIVDCSYHLWVGDLMTELNQ